MSMEQWYPGPVKDGPDFENLLTVLRGEQAPRPVLFEFFLNPALYEWLAGRTSTTEDWPASPDILIDAYHHAGYDYVTMRPLDFYFPAGEVDQLSTKSLNEGAVIFDRASFEAYPWIDPDDCDYSIYEQAADLLPDGMKIITWGPCGVLENLIALIGFENLCMMLADDPELVQEITDNIGRRLVRYYEICCQYETVGAIIGNDDWGFKTQPMLSPTQMRELIVPWHKKIVQVAHDAGRPAILHSCGNLRVLMDDIIDECGYDAKHSYEDTIQPVEEAWDEYHDRIAILGGIDVDFVIRHSPQEVYDRARAMLEKTGNRAYALGTGNSVPDYVPQENYLALIAAATEQRR